MLAAFVADFDFSGASLDEALRAFLQSFRLPGEAQKIDRMMEAFAKAFHAVNPAPFANADAAYVLSFAIIMLNTDAHSKQVVNKMTLEQFVSNNRGINNGENIPRPYLEHVYASITGNEIRMLGGSEEPQLSRAGWALLASRDAQLGRPSKAPPPPDALAGADAETLLVKALWTPTLGALSAVTAAASAVAALRPPMAGFSMCARLCASLGLSSELDAVVATLSQLTALLAAPPPPPGAAAAPGTAARPPAAAAAATPAAPPATPAALPSR